MVFLCAQGRLTSVIRISVWKTGRMSIQGELYRKAIHFKFCDIHVFHIFQTCRRPEVCVQSKSGTTGLWCLLTSGQRLQSGNVGWRYGSTQHTTGVQQFTIWQNNFLENIWRRQSTPYLPSTSQPLPGKDLSHLDELTRDSRGKLLIKWTNCRRCWSYIKSCQ